MKTTVFWDAAPCGLVETDELFRGFTVSVVKAIALMMEPEINSDTSVHLCQSTLRNLPEDSHLFTQHLSQHSVCGRHWTQYLTRHHDQPVVLCDTFMASVFSVWAFSNFSRVCAVIHSSISFPSLISISFSLPFRSSRDLIRRI